MQPSPRDCLLFAAILLLASSCQGPLIEGPEGVRTILERAYERYGGRTNYLGLQSLRHESEVIAYGEEDRTRRSRFRLEFLAPDRLRLEAWSEDGHVIQIFQDGRSREWFQGEETGRDLVGEMRRRLEQMFILSLLEDSPDHPVTLVGRPEVSGRSCHALEVAEGRSTYTVYLDAETYLIRRIRESIVVGGAETVFDVYLDGYRTVSGRPVAWRYVTLVNDRKVQEAHMVQAEVNPDISPDRFSSP